MNREIKFRGKRIDNGAWETGSVIVLRQGLRGEEWFIADKMTGYHTPVSRNTVGQYTELRDRKGKEIYEGDIIKDEYADIADVWRYKLWQVEYSIKRAMFVCRNPDNPYPDTLEHVVSGRITIVGNIYDNPELLEEGK